MHLFQQFDGNAVFDRLVVELGLGAQPSDGRGRLLRQQLCVNPAHLFWGTAKGRRDDVVRGRVLVPRTGVQGRGELTAEDARNIYRLYVTKRVSAFELSRLFRRSLTNIYGIIHEQILATASALQPGAISASEGPMLT